MIDYSFLKKYLLYEVQKVNQSVVKKRILLAKLLEMENPYTETVSHEIFYFDKKVLEILREKISDEVKQKVRLPINFYFSTKVRECYYLTEYYAYKLLCELKEMDEDRKFVEGKLWFYTYLGNRIARKYPTLTQVIIMPSFSEK